MSSSPLVTLQNFVGGEFVGHTGGGYVDSEDPSTGQVWALVPDSGPQDVQLAVTAALKAFSTWSGMAPAARSAILMRIADLLEKRTEEFALAESRDQGKTLTQARNMEISRAVNNFRFFATGMLHQLNTSSHVFPADALEYTTRAPVGVAGLISPWNLPLYLLTFKLAPALAAGCTIVAKPSELTSVTAWMLCDVFKQAGLPAGVVNFVFGTGPKVGDAIVRHPQIPAISFTGSTATAEKIRLACAPFCKKLSLELGGKNPGIVFPDCDMDNCLEGLLRAAFTNQGEVCLCSSRVFVHETIFDEFLTRFVKMARGLKVGDPREQDTKVGALISKDHLAKVRSFVDLAHKEGATVHCGEGVDDLTLKPEHKQGYFFPPTVISGMTDSSDLMQQEIFGPVVCITPFKTEEEVIVRANNTEYGLCSCLFTTDLSTAHRVAKQIECGTVWVNCWLIRDMNMPFGGVKNSGTGREGLQESLEFYTEVKTVVVKLSQSSAKTTYYTEKRNAVTGTPNRETGFVR